METKQKLSKAISLLKKRHYGMATSRLADLTALDDGQSSIDAAWNLYSGALTTFINGGNIWPNLQLVPMASLEQRLNWDDVNFGDYYFHKVSSDLINGPGATYNKTVKSFSERYGLFIQDVQVPPVDIDALNQSIVALGLLDNDNQRHTDLILNLNIEWMAFDTRQRNSIPSSLWIDYDQWWDNNGADIYNNSKQVNLAYYQNFENWVQKAYNGGETIAQILKAYDPTLKKKVKIPTNATNTQFGGVAEIFPYQISDDYVTWLNAAQSGQLARTTLTINKNSYRSDITQSSIAAGIGFGFGFFGIIAAGQRNTVQIDTTSENFSMQFDGVFNTFQLSPGGWYNTSAFDLFRKGPFFPNSAMQNLYTMNGIFGPNGFLSFMSSDAIVVYNPKLTVTFDKDVYHYFDQVTQGFAAFCIGPFAIGGGSYYDHQTSVSRDDDNFTFTFEIKDYAILIGFNSQAI